MSGEFPRVEDLLVPKLVEGYAGLTQEAVVQACLNPLRLPAEKQTLTSIWLLTALARTAVLFVVDYDEAYAATASVDEDSPFIMPPLPFPRIAIEAAGDVGFPLGGVTSPMPIRQARTEWRDSGLIMDVLFINEIAEGQEWQLVLGCRSENEEQVPPGVPYGYVALFYTVHADGRVETFQQTGEMGDLDTIKAFSSGPHDLHAVATRALASEIVHLLNARGVTHKLVPIPRGQQRRFTKRRLVHPKVYWVVIGTSDEPHEGVSGREYHCRWLVRGHWRHFADGSRTWVRPYIKGPPGAPWRGRPIYVTAEAAHV